MILVNINNQNILIIVIAKIYHQKISVSGLDIMKRISVVNSEKIPGLRLSSIYAYCVWTWHRNYCKILRKKQETLRGNVVMQISAIFQIALNDTLGIVRRNLEGNIVIIKITTVLLINQKICLYFFRKVSTKM